MKCGTITQLIAALMLVQYAPVSYGRGDDRSARAFSGKETGFANGDIYHTMSSYGGFDWDPSRSLTTSFIPNIYPNYDWTGKLPIQFTNRGIVFARLDAQSTASGAIQSDQNGQTALTVDSLDNFIIFGNNGNLGRENNLGSGKLNFDFVGDLAECDTGAISYLFDGSPIVSYNNGHVVSAMYSLSIVDSFQFRPQGEPLAETEILYEHASSGLFTTQDSALGLSVDYWTPPGNLNVAGTWKPVIMRVGYYNLTDAPIDSVFCAYGLDWDVPSDIELGNTSAIQPGQAPRYVYQRGAELGMDTGNSACRDNSTRYAATIYTSPQEANLPAYSTGGSGAMGVGFQALYTRDNASFVGGDWNHPALDSMLHSNFGLNRFISADPDSQFVDLHTMFNGGAYRIDPDDTLYLWLRLLTGFGTQAEFEQAAEATRSLVDPGACCLNPGDMNGDGKVDIRDIVGLIRLLFVGGPFGICCAEMNANGDLNGKVNIADITYLIAFIFAGGPAPICGPPGIACLL